MAEKGRIEDAGEKLGGARKDMPPTNTADAPSYRVDQCTGKGLDLYWPKPAKWTDLIPAYGVERAVLAMILRGQLNPMPHTDNWHGIPGDDWAEAYPFGITILRALVERTGPFKWKELANEFHSQMGYFASMTDTPMRWENQWSYAIGKAHKRSTHSPFHLTPYNEIRLKYLHRCGWGENPLVPDKLSMGALELVHRVTGEVTWRAVEGKSTKWVYLDDAVFQSEQEALACAQTYVEKELLEIQAKADAAQARKDAIKARKQREKAGQSDNPADPAPAPENVTRKWLRPIVPSKSHRVGFERPSATLKTEQDLIDTFGFRGIEFGNWVTQTERQDFVNGIYDALLDLCAVIGAPPRLASLNGTLGLGYGSRGHGLAHAAAHFEPDNWILHFTKDSGQGAVAHEVAHALDFGVAHLLKPMGVDSNPYSWDRDKPFGFTELDDDAWSDHASPYATALRRWSDQVNWNVRYLSLHDPANRGRLAWKWLEESRAMDGSRKKPYWADPCEIFARSFEVLIHDSLAAKGRANHMLVYGVSQELVAQAREKHGQSPYPVGEERLVVCQEMAAAVRAIKRVFYPGA